MKSFGVLALAGLAAASPRPLPQLSGAGLFGSQLGGGGSILGQTENDLKNGNCKGVTFIMARASTEIGNMGVSMGPKVCSGLKSKFRNDVACQGIGDTYSASLMDNVLPAGTSRGATAEAQQWFRTAVQKCPNTKIVAGGYSQGSAVMSTSISGLDAATRDRILGVVLFGYTKNAQNRGGIPSYPNDRVKVFCATSDGVCGGMLLVTLGHFAYLGNGDGTKATNFLAEKINAAPAPSAAGGAAAAAPVADAAPAPASGLSGLLSKFGGGGSGLGSLFGRI